MIRVLIAASCLSACVALSSGATVGAGASSPFFMFSTSRFGGAERDAMQAVLDASVTSGDYLGLQVAAEFPQAGARVGRSHLYALPTSVASVARRSAECGPGTAGLIIYDGEHWTDTPVDEQADMPGAIARAKQSVVSAGCNEFGVAPDGQMVGVVPSSCSYDLNRALHRNVDWSGIALFNIQAQRLLSDACNDRAGVPSYVAFVTAVAREVHLKNPAIRVSAQLSFRYTPPGRMVDAIKRLRGIVDGFYVAYPSNVGPTCAYCSPGNLATVLEAIHSS